jgi:opacity protein-like surface antigen
MRATFQILAAIAAILGVPAGAQAQGYLRAGLGYDVSETSRVQDADCSATAPPALFGCGAAPDGSVLAARGDMGRTAALELGAGRRLAPYLRGEVQAAWRPGLAFDGRANFLRTPGDQQVSAKVDSKTLIAAAYFDFGALGRLRPFIGLGAGAARNRVGAMRYAFPGLAANAATITPGGSRTSFTWMATAGVAWPLSNRLTLDLAYRYADLGKVRTEAGPAAIVRASGTRAITIAPTQAGLIAQGVSASVRWGF